MGGAYLLALRDLQCEEEMGNRSFMEEGRRNYIAPLFKTVFV